MALFDEEYTPLTTSDWLAGCHQPACIDLSVIVFRHLGDSETKKASGFTKGIGYHPPGGKSDCPKKKKKMIELKGGKISRARRNGDARGFAFMIHTGQGTKTSQEKADNFRRPGLTFR